MKILMIVTALLVGIRTLLLAKGAPPVAYRPHCDLIDGPEGICTYRCDALRGIITRPEDRTIPPGRGSVKRPYCYSSILLGR